MKKDVYEDDEAFEKENGLVAFYRNNKVIVWILIIVLLVILVLKFMPENKITVNPSGDDIQIAIEGNKNISIGKGSTTKLTVSINVDNPVINWLSSNTSVAKVENGIVTGVDYGNATITALYIDNDGNKFTSTCEVIVVEGNPNVTLNSISFQDGDLYMPVNKTYPLSLILNPSNALVSEKMFISSDDNVVTVSDDGVVKSIREGNARIIATVNNKYKATIDVYVGSEYNKSEIVISPTSLSFSGTSRKIKVGSSEKIDYSVSPSKADKTKITWASSDPSVVSVDQSGKIVARSEGTAIISITSINGRRDDMTVEVYQDIVEVTDILISSSTITMDAGQTQVITPVVTPDNASNKGLGYSSSDTNIVSVTVNSTGTSAILSALNRGTAIITLKSGNVEKKITVNVVGEGNNNQDESPTSDTYIQVRSDKNNLAKSYTEAKLIPVPGETTVSISMAKGVGKIKYCINKYTSNTYCKPNIEMYSNDTVQIPSGGMYVLRIIKYDYRDNEIESSSKNYVDGVLNYYINTESDDRTKLYTVDGAYDTSAAATSSPIRVGEKININVNDTSRHLKVCITTSVTCTPTISVTSKYTYTLSSAALYRIFVIEYDKNNNIIGNTEVYYAYTNSTGTNSTNYTHDDVTVSNLKIVETTNGYYLSANVQSDTTFNNTRFCYDVINKDTSGTCNLDIISNSVDYYNNGSLVKPKQKLKTYYATLTSSKNYTFKFYIDDLKEFYDNNITYKDVIFEFAVKKTTGYSNPIAIRINMNSKTGSTATWNLTRIK